MFLIHKSKRAEKDLTEIWLYSFKNWGAGRADLYLSDMESVLKTIAENPQIGTDCLQIRRSYRKFKINEHFIWYTVRGRKMTVVRVLHKSMDYQNHF